MRCEIAGVLFGESSATVWIIKMNFKRMPLLWEGRSDGEDEEDEKEK